MYDLFYQKLLLYLKYHFKNFEKVDWVYNSFFECYFYNFDFESGCLECSM